MNFIEKKAWVRLAYMAGMGREPESLPVLDAWATQILDDASNLEGTLVQILDSTESVAYRAAVKQASISGPGPAGPPGPQGPPGPAGSVTISGTFPVTPT